MIYAKLLLVGSVFCLFFGCVPQTIQPQNQTIATNQSKWNVGCQPDQRDPYGKLVERRKCWAMLTDFRQSNQGLTHGVESIFEVNHDGPIIVMQRKRDADICDHRAPKKKAVDGRRIDHLSKEQQINAIRSGRVFVRETNRGWPYCNLNNTVAHIDGADRAYSDMMSQWERLVQK